MFLIVLGMHVFEVLAVGATIKSVLEKGNGTNEASALRVHYEAPTAPTASAASTDQLQVCACGRKN